MPANASSTRLAGVTDPEAKRKIIGGEFIAFSTRRPIALRKKKADRVARAGTLYPDVIESLVRGSVIMSHHRRGKPENMNSSSSNR